MTPLTDANQMRPDQSGSAEMIAVADAHRAGQVVVALDPKARRLGLPDHEHVAGGGGDHGPVAVVEVEVATTGEVGERAGVAVGLQLSRRKLQAGQLVQRVGLEHHQARALEPYADGDQAATAIEGVRGAVGRLGAGGAAHAAPERPEPAVAVGLPCVGVEVAEPVRGHERMTGRFGGEHRVGIGGGSHEYRQLVRVGALDDRLVPSQSRSCAQQREGGCAENAPPAHGRHGPHDAPQANGLRSPAQGSYRRRSRAISPPTIRYTEGRQAPVDSDLHLGVIQLEDLLEGAYEEAGDVEHDRPPGRWCDWPLAPPAGSRAR